MPHSALIFGQGYLGRRVAALWTRDGRAISAVTRSAERAAEIQSLGISPIVADVTDATTLTDLPSVDAVLFAVGYDRSSDQSIDQVYAGGVRNVLAALPRNIGRLIYISTTGVYGDAAGDWIDETTPPNPSRAGGRASLAAEESICQSPFADRAVVLRLAGIYGSGRLPYLALLQAGKAIEAVPTGHLNLIHVDDAARIVHALSEPNREIAGPAVYNVCDGHPVRRAEFYREAARQLSAPEPTFVAPHQESHRAARAATDRRVSNEKLVADIKVEFQFPSYREGLAAILQSF